jgi:predicted acetyltransferase
VTLRLRPYRLEDESAALAAHEALRGDEFNFLLGWNMAMRWSEFLQSIDEQRHGLIHSEYQVRGIQLVADVDGELVGRTSLRFELNEFFATKGGHIGYGVVPAHRRKGYATEILRQALIVIRAEGVNPVLVTCSDDNVGSYGAIENNGGVLESVVPSGTDAPGLRRYWFY